MLIDQKLNDAANLAAAAAPLLDQFANGDENTVIQGRHGPYPSQAKAAKDAITKIVENFQPEVASINEHAAHVTAEADRSTAEASKAAQNNQSSANHADRSEA
ncbi:hypothetical protein, partial [Kistimonas scapharcae]|uniref:hypothetical protein n=1 Tax=Kistimonas scapharcae TaxID=1036133 RepID=UPI0031E83B80